MLPLKKCRVSIGIIFLLFLAYTTPASAYWFHTVSGNIYSDDQIIMTNGTTVLSTPTYLSRSSNGRGSSGIINYVNNLNFNDADGSETGTQLEENWIQRLVPNSKERAAHKGYLSQYNYAYFVRKLSGEATSASETSYCNQGGSSGVRRYSAALTIHCNSNSSDNNDATNTGREAGPNAGRDLILLVNGDVTITDSTGVPDDGFFMVVSSGTITIDNAVGGSDLDPGIQGVFIANRIVTTRDPSAPHSRLYAEGIFIAHQEFVLNRRAGTDTEPAEMFYYKPSLLVRAPWTTLDRFDGYEEVEP